MRLADLVGEVEAGEAGVALSRLSTIAEALEVVLEAAVVGHELVERVLAGVAEGRVAEVVGEGDGFGEVLVEAEGAGDGAGDLRRLRGCG